MEATPSGLIYTTKSGKQRCFWVIEKQNWGKEWENSDMYHNTACNTSRNHTQTTTTPATALPSSPPTTHTEQPENYLSIRESDTKKMIDLLSPNSSPSLPTRKSKNLKNLQLNLTNSPRNNINNHEIPNTSIPLPNQRTEDSTAPNSSSSLNTLKTPVLSRTPTPTGNLPAVGAGAANGTGAAISPFSNPRPLQHFRRMASFNSSSPSSSSACSSINGNSIKLNLSGGNSNGSTNTINNSNINNNQRKRSATTLAINIPVHDVEAENNGDSPGNGHAPGGGLKSAYGDFIFNYDTDLPNDRNASKTNNKKIPVLPFEKPQKRTSSMDFSSQDSLSLSPISFSSPSISLPAKPFPVPVDLNSSGQLYSSEIKPQTIMHSFDESKMDETNAETFKMAYPNGPICVLKPNLYLYSEPTFDEVTDFDVIINVAQEIKDYTNQVDERNKIAEIAGIKNFDNISIDSQNREKLTFRNSRQNIEYYFIPWTHTSRLTSDFPYLTALIEKSLKSNKKVLIHCQCGVSRSASLIMAYFMKVFGGGYNEAYGRLKQIVPQISPNLSLIYELIEWGEWLEKGQSSQ